jgi:RNA polymerase sigma-70 factor (ECF subfamily)
MSGHLLGMRPAAALDAACPDGRVGSDPQAGALAGERPAFAEVYEAYFDYVWRVARRLGAEPSWLDDVTQDVFVTVHRRLADFEGRSSVRTWLYGITLRVVRDYRRTRRRKPTQPLPDEELPREGGSDPERATQHAESVALLHALLDGLGDDKREVFVLTELEQLSAPEIALLLELNVNTVYARLRTARADFERALQRHRARHAEEKR